MQYLYLIKCQQYYKIGIAADVEGRLAQLSTGNPFPLVVEIVYKFDNAESVERVLHQKYKEKKQRGEWFSLSYQDTVDIHKICLMLDGCAFEGAGSATDDAIEEAEEIAESKEDGKWDYAAMFADGWRMDAQDSRGLYWNWRKGSNEQRKTIYGGAVKNLPYSLEQMRLVYRDTRKVEK